MKIAASAFSGTPSAAGAEAEQVMARPPGDAVPADTVALVVVGDARLAVHDGVDLVAAAGQPARHLEHVDASPRAAGDALVGGDVDDPHRAVGRSRPKKGPVRTPPKRTTSSFSSQVRPLAAARV